jgi:hypothetical protein
MAVLAGLMAVAVLLLGLGRGLNQYYQNVVINLGADLVGAIVTIFVITPIVRRASEGRVREHPRLDYAWYVDRVAGATSAVRIIDTFSNLLDGPHTAHFFRAVELALERQAVVQILLLDPDSLAARQRAHELDDPDVYREIMRNLRVLYDFRNTVLPASLGRNFSVRMYTASPSITAAGTRRLWCPSSRSARSPVKASSLRSPSAPRWENSSTSDSIPCGPWARTSENLCAWQ